MPFLAFIAILFILIGSPFIVEGDPALPRAPIDNALGSPLTSRSESDSVRLCPDTSSNPEDPGFICAISGVVEGIRIENGPRSGRLAISLGNETFFYLMRDGDSGASITFFTTSKVNQMPVSMRFQNWGGRYYITEANF